MANSRKRQAKPTRLPIRGGAEKEGKEGALKKGGPAQGVKKPWDEP
ncbi:hypothetical protein ACIQVN_20325 [Streptomyces cyaneofuscatus]|nr:hypothetical protein OG323_28485 [Streptomyces cyaneofuscatus]